MSAVPSPTPPSLPAHASGYPDQTAELRARVLDWFAQNARDLPWRAPATSPWGVLVSEVMAQQTPVGRVAPRWVEWMARWPGPRELAAAPIMDVLRAWDRLGYPQRALRLAASARVVVEQWDGELPRTEVELRTLPGVGEYTAAAVVAFAYGERAVVLDTNVRRVLARLVGGVALPAPSLTRAERNRAAALLPGDPATSARWNIALMEFGALVCRAATPDCAACPVRSQCAWRAAGYPADTHAPRRRPQAWHGTDRQVRGRVMALLREAGDAPVPASVVRSTLADVAEGQLERALAGLVADGLAAHVAPDGAGAGVDAGHGADAGQRLDAGSYTLPS